MSLSGALSILSRRVRPEGGKRRGASAGRGRPQPGRGCRSGPRPGRDVFVFENGARPAERVTAADLAAGGIAVADALPGLGLRRGDRVAVLLRNHPALLHTLVAGAKLGLPLVPLDPEASDLTVETRLRALGCAALVTADYRLADGDLAGVIDRTGVKSLAVSTPEGRAAGHDPSADHPVLDEALDVAPGRDPGEHVDDPTAPG